MKCKKYSYIFILTGMNIFYAEFHLIIKTKKVHR